MSEEKKKDELVVEHSKTVDTSIQLIDIELKQVVGDDGGSKPDIFIDNGTGYTNRKIYNIDKDFKKYRLFYSMNRFNLFSSL